MVIAVVACVVFVEPVLAGSGSVTFDFGTTVRYGKLRWVKGPQKTINSARVGSPVYPQSSGVFPRAPLLRQRFGTPHSNGTFNRITLSRPAANSGHRFIFPLQPSAFSLQPFFVGRVRSRRSPPSAPRLPTNALKPSPIRRPAILLLLILSHTRSLAPSRFRLAPRKDDHRCRWPFCA
jgi:hypothetical protein